MRAGYKVAAAGLFVALGCVLAFSAPRPDVTDASTAAVSASESPDGAALSGGSANRGGSASSYSAASSDKGEAVSTAIAGGGAGHGLLGDSSATGSAAESVSDMIADRVASSVAAGSVASGASADEGSASSQRAADGPVESDVSDVSGDSDASGASGDSEGSTGQASPTEAPDEPVSYRDGTYRSAAEGKLGSVPVTVVVDGGRIVSVTVGANSEVAQMINKAEETVIPQIIENQSVDGVETATGATISSQAIVEAVADVVSRAIVE